MERIEKTVFISYRRTNIAWAQLIYKTLTASGYDVFLDYTGTSSGDFERAILDNIIARAHFLVLLTPSALERCGDPADLFRREIETALDTNRNIVPLMLEGFDFDTPKIASQLTGKLAALKKISALFVPPEYFEAAIDRLRRQYLNVPLAAVPHSASPFARQAATEQKAAADAAPAVRKEELTSQQWFERAVVAASDKGDTDGALQDLNEAIRLKPNYAEAFLLRGGVRGDKKGDMDGALQDLNEAIRLKPDYAEAFYNRAVVRRDKGDMDGALQDCNEAIRLKPDFTEVLTKSFVITTLFPRKGSFVQRLEQIL